MPRNTRNGVTVHVPIEGYAGLKYVFNSRNDPGDREILGQELLAATETNVAGYVIGVNAPKPPRAKKDKTTGSESGFYDHTNRAELIAAGWQLTKGKAGRSPSVSGRSDFVYVTINGVKYAWYCPRSAGAAGLDPDAVALGVKPVTANDLVVYGAQFPVPPRFKKALNGGIYSTFYDPSVTEVPEGVTTVAGRNSLGELLTFIKADNDAA